VIPTLTQLAPRAGICWTTSSSSVVNLTINGAEVVGPLRKASQPSVVFLTLAHMPVASSSLGVVA
jgi:hypothetical protein